MAELHVPNSPAYEAVMRVTTDLWVSALMRRVFSAGGFAAIVNRGSPEAGAVHLLTRDRLGDMSLFSPAPQTSYDTSKPNERLFLAVPDLTNEQIEARLEKEKRFDPDIWIVELEMASEKIGDLIALKVD